MSKFSIIKGGPVEFNAALDNPPDCNILCFMSPSDTITKGAEKTIVNTFDRHPEISAVYTDNFSICDSEHRPVQRRLYYPTYTYNMCKDLIINTPICCKASGITERFDESIKHLCFCDILVKLCQSRLLWHIPEVLFVVSVVQQSDETQQELERIFNE